MFCGKCGARIGNGERFCSACGTPVMQAGAETFNYMDYGQAAVYKDKKKKQALLGVCALAAIVVVVAVIGFVITLGTSEEPEVVVKKFMHAAMTDDFDTCNTYLAFDMYKIAKITIDQQFDNQSEEEWNAFVQKNGTNDKEKIKQEIWKEAEETLEETKERNQENREAYFGADYTVDVVISGKEEVLRYEERQEILSPLYQIGESLGKSYNINVNDIINVEKIEEVCKVYGNTTMQGNKKTETQDFEIDCVKIDGKWRVFDSEAAISIPY